jgi:hypothetical protein
MLASHAVIPNVDFDATVELSVEDQIECFLYGETDGKALLEALYGATIDEPVPEQLTALVRNAGSPTAS